MQPLISFAVVAHNARLPEATELARTIGAIIALDDPFSSNGPVGVPQ